MSTSRERYSEGVSDDDVPVMCVAAAGALMSDDPDGTATDDDAGDLARTAAVEVPTVLMLMVILCYGVVRCFAY